LAGQGTLSQVTGLVHSGLKEISIPLVSENQDYYHMQLITSFALWELRKKRLAVVDRDFQPLAQATYYPL